MRSLPLLALTLLAAVGRPPSQSAGPHTWRLTLDVLRGLVETEVPLEMTATVVTEVTVQPAALTLVVEGAIHPDVILTDLRARPLALTRVTTSSPRLLARPTGP